MISRAAATPVTWVLAPASSATGVLDALALIEKPWKKPVATLAAPMAMSSWLESTVRPSLAAYERDRTLVSAKETKAMPIAAPTRFVSSDHDTSGTWNEGRPAGQHADEPDAVGGEVEHRDDDDRPDHREQDGRHPTGDVGAGRGWWRASPRRGPAR